MLGIMCKMCNKILREHTKQIYIPVSARKPCPACGETHKFAIKVINRLFSLTICSPECEQLYEEMMETRKENRKIPKHVRRALFKKYDSKCFSCGSKDKLEIHHIVPICKGGTSELENLLLLCNNCHCVVSNRSGPKTKKYINYRLNPEFQGIRERILNKIKPLMINEDKFFECYPLTS